GTGNALARFRAARVSMRVFASCLPCWGFEEVDRVDGSEFPLLALLIDCHFDCGAAQRLGVDVENPIEEQLVAAAVAFRVDSVLGNFDDRDDVFSRGEALQVIMEHLIPWSLRINA